MIKAKCTAKQIIEAIPGSGGIKFVIARRLGVHRHSVDNYITRYPSVKEAYENEVESVGDLAESVILKKLQQEDLETAKWYARMKLKNRGYTERQDEELEKKLAELEKQLEELIHESESTS